MKKIVRLIFAVVILLLLFYITNFVNECRQMRDVFSSFVIVENPSSVKQCNIINETLQRSYDYLHFLDNPKPIWTDTGGHFVYSAFWKNDWDKKYAVGLGVGPAEPRYQCSVWFDFKNIVSSVKGQFSYVTSKRNSTVNIYKFICLVEEEDVKGEPYMLVLINTEGNKKKSHIPIFHKTISSFNSNETAVCIRPDPAGIGKADIIEFVSFHLLIGVTDLVLYGNEIHNSIVHRMRQLIGASNFLRSISILPWNFPYQDQSLELSFIETDCEYRTFKITKAFVVLEWDQYVVPNNFKPILDVLQFDNNNLPYAINTLSQLCCLESVNDKRSETSWPIILKKTYCTNYPFTTVFKVHGEDIGNDNSAVIKNFNSTISVKTYRSCEGMKGLKTKYDHSPFKFLSGLLSSELLRLWNTGSMF